MAHIAKYKATSVGHMLAHYRRDPSSLGRENIDPARVGMDYTLALDPADGLVKPMEGVEPNWATVEERIERVNERAKAEGKRAVRKDAVVMADVVVTLPENVREGDEGAFFGWTAWAGNCGPHQKARAEKCADDHKGAQTRFGGLGARLRTSPEGSGREVRG